MAVQKVLEIERTLSLLKKRRLSGQLSRQAFYLELLEITTQLFQEMKEELVQGHLQEHEVDRQIPLISAILFDQITRLKQRKMAQKDAQKS